MMLHPDTMLTVIGLGACAAILFTVAATRAGYGLIALSIVIEFVLVAVAARGTAEAWVLPVCWGFVAILAALAEIGADLRRTLEKKPVASSPVAVEKAP
jgi:hypothetical protein